MKKRTKSTHSSRKIVAICAALIVAALSFMTVGFAHYNRILDVSGDISLKTQGKIYVSNVTFVDGKNVSSNPTFTDNSIDFGLKVFASKDQTEYYANFEVTVINDTFYDQTFSTNYWQTQFTDKNGKPVDTLSAEYELIGIKNGDVIKHGETIKFNIRATFAPTVSGDFTVIGGIDINFSETNTGFLLAYVKEPLTGDLRKPNTSAAFTVHVSNSFTYAKTFSLILASNSKLTLSGTALNNITIPANSEADYVVYVSIAGTQDFPSTYERATILMRSGGADMNAGRITLYVDQSVIYTDHEAPQISNVKISALNAVGEAQVTWSATDDVTIKDFTVEIFDTAGNLIQTKKTTDDTTSISFTGLSAGDYYVRVYGEDSLGNTATAADLTACSTAAGPCSRSETTNLLWQYKVTHHLDRVTTTGASTVTRGETYTASYSTSFLNVLPAEIVVKMDGRTLTAGTDYTYSRNTGTLTVPNVTGDLDITVTAESWGCLTAGTQILLADGTTKPIEGIGYNDLLAVWNYETGQLDAEYPIWIERKHTAISYRLTRFSDGSELKTVMHHGVFDVDKNQFVSVSDPDFTPGTKVYKLVDGHLRAVRVESTAIVYETVEYYHVVSARFYNIIANGIITTDGTVALSNLYGFDTDMRWPALREAYLAQPGSVYDYAKFADTVPEFMFVGMRMGEIKAITDAGYMSIDDFKGYLATNQVAPHMWLKPQSRLMADDLQNFDLKSRISPTILQNKRIWPVSVGDYKTTIAEGADFTLPATSTYYRNSVDGQIYKRGDRVKIMCGTHFAPVK